MIKFSHSSLSGLQISLYDLYWPFSIFMVFLMSFKAIDIKNCQIKAKSTFLEFLDKFCQKLPFSDTTVLNYQEVKIKLFGMIGTPPGDKWF